MTKTLAFFACLSFWLGFADLYGQTGFVYDGPLPCLGATPFVNAGLEITDPPAGAFTFEWTVTSPSGVVINNSSNNPLGISFDEAGCWAVVLEVNGTEVANEACGVEIFLDPTAAIDPVSLTGCAPFSPILNNASIPGTGAITDYSWSVGFCPASPAENIAEGDCTINTDGSYDITLSVEDENGCFNTLYLDDVIIVSTSPPNAGFSSSSLIDCNVPVDISFGSTSTAANEPMSFSWTLDGDLLPETGDTLEYTFLASGIYQVCLDVTDVLGCADSFCQTIEIFDAPAAAFTVDPNIICAGMTVDFQNESTPTPIPDISWDLDGDGVEDATGNASTFSYPVAGAYDVQLAVSWSEQCADTLIQTVTVDPPIEALFDLDTLWGCSLPFTVALDDQSFGTGNLTYDWFYLDQNNNPTPIFLTGNTFTFNDWGSYTFGLTLSNDIGCFDEFVFPQSVVLQEPQLAFYLQAPSTCVGDVINTVIWQNQSLDPFVNWYYDIGCDGSVDQEVLGNLDGNTTFVFNAAGTYDVCLVAESENGCSESFQSSITIAPQIFSSFTVSDETPCGIDSVLFSATNPDPGLTYEWVFGDGATSGLGPFVDYEYSYCDTGVFDITLNVSNNGCFTSSTIEDLISVVPPIANFNIQTNCSDYYTVQFENTSILPDTSLIVWTIDGVDMYFGEWEPTHTFATEGLHEVTLYVENPLYNCSDLKTRTVKINEPSFEVAIGPTSGCPPVVVNVDPLDTECVVFWQVQLEGTDFLQAELGVAGWNLDWDVNGNTGSPNNQPAIDWPAVVYNQLGTYDIAMSLTDANGCTIDTLYQGLINVDIDPFFAQIDSSVTRYCDSTVVCVSPVLDGLSGFEWSTNTGLSATSEDTCFTFFPPYNQGEGSIITLSALDNGGCPSTVSDSLFLAPITTACAEADNYTLCKGQLVTLNSSCSTCAAEPCTNAWDLDGDGLYDDVFGSGATVGFDENGNYAIGLLVTDANGCESTTSLTVDVHTPEIELEMIETEFACISTINFTNLTTGPGIGAYWEISGYNDDGPIDTYTDNTSGAFQTVGINENTIGVYDLYMEVTNSYGCTSDTLMLDFLGYGEAAGDFSYTLDVLDCAPYTVTAEAFNPLDNTFQYTWNMGDNTPYTSTTLTHDYFDPGLYTISLTMTDPETNCTFSLSGEEFEVTLLTFPFEGETSICPGEQTTIAVPGLDSLIWLNDLEWIVPSGPETWTLSPPASTTFQATGYADGCYTTQDLEITVYDLPLISAGSFGPFCKNEGEIVLPVVAPASGQLSFNGESVAALDSYMIDAGLHQLNYALTTADGCLTGIDIPFQVLDTTTTSMESVTLCFGSPALDLSDYASHAPGLFSVDYGLGWVESTVFDTAQLPEDAIGILDIPVMYDFVNPEGCSSRAEAIFTVLPFPEAQFVATNTCAGEPVVLEQLSTVEGSVLVAYEWSLDGNPFDQDPLPLDFHLDTAGEYTIQLLVTSMEGCSDSMATVLSIYPNPQIVLAAESVCLGEATSLGVDFSDPTVTIGNWSTSWGDTSMGAEETVHNYAAAGDYTVTVSAESDFGCVSQTSINTEIFPLPTADLSLTDHCFGDLGMGQDLSEVDGGSIAQATWTLPAEGATYTGASFGHAFSEQGEYEVLLTATSNSGCEASAAGFIEVFPLPLPAFEVANFPTCEQAEVYLFDASSVEAPAAITTIEWQIGEELFSGSELTLVFPNPTTSAVTLTVTSSDGCSASLTQADAIEIFPKPEAAFSLSPNPATVVDNLVFLNDQSFNTVAWEYAVESAVYETQNASHIFAASGEYELMQTVVSPEGCLDTAWVTLLVLPELLVHVPNAVTMDNDGFNEVFYPVLFGDEVDVYEFSIYDRWGELIFYSEDPTDVWTGSVRSGEHYANVGVYPWRLVIKGREGELQEFQGSVTVIR